ncbi:MULTISPECIES: hypothetical protein [unclassified Bradyrhizobium]|uniref:hypothetical protein n=1 Tax=unclassified Bradyrhizobium TaxID=2631580 RepID=UPI003398C628
MTAGALTIADQSLVVFVDDTGHEVLVPRHPVYGLGGCAVMAGDLDRLIRHPWHEVRRKVTGSADTPLHAAAFFRTEPFARIGATVTGAVIRVRLDDRLAMRIERGELVEQREVGAAVVFEVELQLPDDRTEIERRLRVAQVAEYARDLGADISGGKAQRIPKALRLAMEGHR